MTTFTRTITEEFFCVDCRYQSINEEFLVEFQTNDSDEPAFGFIYCPSCGGGDSEVSLEKGQEQQ
jgi:DNA-directed RNA polymerase subunit M/transcription elongation factor TFIIS